MGTLIQGNKVNGNGQYICIVQFSSELLSFYGFYTLYMFYMLIIMITIDDYNDHNYC